MSQQDPPNRQPLTHVGGCQCEGCDGERALLDRCLTVLRAVDVLGTPTTDDTQAGTR